MSTYKYIHTNHASTPFGKPTLHADPTSRQRNKTTDYLPTNTDKVTQYTMPDIACHWLLIVN